MLRIAALLSLFALPAFAQFSPRGGELREDLGMRGLYAGVGGGAGLMIAGEALSRNALGYDAELRLGYSFSPATQIYLSGAYDAASFGGDTTAVKLIGASVQYKIAGGPNVFGYTRFGLGVGLTSVALLPPGSGGGGGDATLAGLAGWGGIGLEIRLQNSLFLAPELVYRNASMSGSGASMGMNYIGLQLNLIYY